MFGSKVQLLKLTFTKVDLAVLPEREILFVIQTTNLLQDITSLQKIIHMSSHGVSNDTERIAETSQAMYFLRILAGTLFEGWKLLKLKKYVSVRADYDSNLRPIGKRSRKAIESYFNNKKNAMKRIRNKFSYHYDFSKVRESYHKIPTKDALDMIIGGAHGNCRYTVSDLTVNLGLINAWTPKEMEPALDKLLKEAFELARAFMDLIAEYITLFASRVPTAKRKKIVLRGVPRLSKQRLHYYMIGK